MSKISRKLKRKKRQVEATDPLLQKAIAYYKERNWQGADDTCRQLLSKNSKNDKALNLLSVVLTNKPDFVTAEEYVRQAIKIKPNEPAYYSNLGLILKEQEKWDAAFEAFTRACDINPNDDESYYNLGTVYQALKKTEQAKECYRKARLINPDHVQAACGLCNLLSRRQEDRNELDQVMHQLEVLLSKPGIAAKEQIFFELARVNDMLGNHERVFAFLDPANKMVRNRFNYDIEHEKLLLSSIAHAFTPDLLREKRGNGSDEPAPIFIIGMPRSGTTLVEQILASHSQVAAGGELSFLTDIIVESPHLAVPFQVDTIKLPNYARIHLLSGSDIKKIAEAYLHATASLRAGKKYFTDKMPHNFIHLGMINLLFPNSKVIHCQRDPLDNCLSLYMQNFKIIHPYIYSLEEIGAYYAAYHKLMSHWRELLPGFFHEIGYENLVNSPEEEMRKLLRFCGLEWEETCLEFYNLKRYIRTASEGQADQPLYTSSIGRWKKYEGHLLLLKKILVESGITD